MKNLLRWGALLLMVGTMAAQTAPRKKTVRKAVTAAPAITAEDVKALRDALAAQQQQIEALKQAMASRDAAWQQGQQKLMQAQADAGEAKTKAAAIEASANQQQESVTRLSSDMADVKSTITNSAISTQDDQKRVSALETTLGRFRFNGDVRVRGESFFLKNTADRNRARVRVRFGFEGKLNDSFAAGVAISTGSLGDPTSVNTTFTNFFDRKTIGLDRAYLTYQPGNHKWLQLTGGKFAYTWIRTPVTFDSDLNPEGFGEKMSFDFHGPIKNVTVGAMQILFNEASKGADSYATGGQISARLEPFGSWWTMTPSFSAIKWNKPDAILQAGAFAVQATSGGVIIPPGTTPTPVPTPGEGPGCATTGSTLPKVPPCVFAPGGFTNANTVDAAGVPHYLSGFFYADFILNNTIKTPWKRLPLNVLAEYEDNLNAADHPIDSTGVINTAISKQSHAYYFDVSMGQVRNKGDVQFGYAWLRQEQDSVLASFNESDQRAPTNTLQNRIYGLWRVHPNVTAAYTVWIGRTLNTNLANAIKGSGVAIGAKDNNLKRMQFDLIYSF